MVLGDDKMGRVKEQLLDEDCLEIKISEIVDINGSRIHQQYVVDDKDDYSDWVIKQKIGSYYINNIKTGHKLDYNEYDRLCGIVYDLAIYDRDSKHHTFILSNESMDNYFKKAKVQVLIQDYGDEIYILVTEDNVNVKINEIKHLIDKMGIRYTVYIEDNQLDNVLKEYLSHHTHDYGELVVNSSVINGIIDMCIDGFMF